MWFLSRWSKKYTDRIESLEQELGYAHAELGRLKAHSQNIESELNVVTAECAEYKSQSIYQVFDDMQNFSSTIDQISASLIDIGEQIDITLKERGMLVEVRDRFGKYINSLKNLHAIIENIKNTHMIEFNLIQTAISTFESRARRSQKLLEFMEDFERLANDLYGEHLRNLLETSNQERLKRDQATIRQMREKLAELARRERLLQGRNPKAMATAISPPIGTAHPLPKGFPGRRQPPPSSL